MSESGSRTYDKGDSSHQEQTYPRLGQKIVSNLQLVLPKLTDPYLEQKIVRNLDPAKQLNSCL